MVSRLFIFLVCHAAGLLPLRQQEIVTVRTDDYVVYKGKSNSIRIWLEVKEGFHIQANRIDDASLIPTAIEVADDPKVIVTHVKFPSGKKYKLEGTDAYLKVYDGKIAVKLFLRPAPQAPTGRHVMITRLKYQACDSRTCLFPRTIEFAIPMSIQLK